MGIISYLFAPMAFLYQDLKLFIQIMNLIMMVMIFGLILLLNLLQPYVEWVVLRVLCRVDSLFRRQPFLRRVISKNMESHRGQNQ